MSRKINVLAAVWSLALVSTAVAQGAGTLSGVVLDSDGQPLPGATITVSGPTLTEKTGSLAGASGVFTIAPLPS